MRALLDLQIARDLASDSDLSDSDYDVLSTLTEGEVGSDQGSADGAPPAWRATALADRLLWSTSRLAHHVGRMERRGLVGRGTCGDDGRGSTVFLTALGRQVLEDAAPLHVESVRRHLIDVLTAEEIEQLAAIAEQGARPPRRRRLSHQSCGPQRPRSGPGGRPGNRHHGMRP